MERGKKPPCDVTFIIWNTAKEIKEDHAEPRGRLKLFISLWEGESIYTDSILCMEKREELQMTEF